jgi:hypothetical protein
VSGKVELFGQEVDLVVSFQQDDSEMYGDTQNLLAIRALRIDFVWG